MARSISRGDVVLVSGQWKGLTAASIMLGAKLRYGLRSPHARYTHAALIYDAPSQDPNAIRVVEATARGGVHKAFLSKYQSTGKIVATHIDDHDWQQVRAFLDSVLRAREGYDWATYAGLTLYDLTGTRLCLQKAGTATCSGLVCDALTRAGFIWSRPPYACTPSDIDADLAQSDSWQLQWTRPPAREVSRPGSGTACA